MRTSTRIRVLLPALLAASLLTGPLPARAQTAEPDPGTADGPRKVALYAGCATSVFMSGSIPTLILAVISCGKIVLDEIDRANG